MIIYQVHDSLSTTKEETFTMLITTHSHLILDAYKCIGRNILIITIILIKRFSSVF